MTILAWLIQTLILAVTAFDAVAADGVTGRIREALTTHEQVLAARARAVAAERRFAASRGAYYPTLDLSSRSGWEEQFKEEGEMTDMGYREVTLKATQLLCDYGLTGALLDGERLRHEQGLLRLAEAEEQVLFDAAASHERLIKMRRTFDYAIRSEENVRRQTGIEEIRITAGSGLNSDLLQAKGQLAGAMARRVEYESQLEFAVNRYRLVFGMEPPQGGMVGFGLVESLLPSNLDDALVAALADNRRLLGAAIDVALAREGLKRQQATSYRPRIEMSAERNLKDNVAGVAGYKRETLVQLRLNYSFNLGLSAVDGVEAAEADLEAARQTLDLLQDTVDEEVRNAWRGLHAAIAKARFLEEQAELTAGFLLIAKEERALGNRSLIDVLSAETSLITAQSDAQAARSDVVLEALGLLRLMGRLDINAVEEMAVAGESERAGQQPDRQSLHQDGDGLSMRLVQPGAYLGRPSSRQSATRFSG